MKRKIGCTPEKWTKKKKEEENFHENEQSKGGKTKVVLSIMPCDATYICQDNEDRHLKQWWSDGHEVELWQTNKWAKQLQINKGCKAKKQHSVEAKKQRSV